MYAFVHRVLQHAVKNKDVRTALVCGWQQKAAVAVNKS